MELTSCCAIAARLQKASATCSELQWQLRIFSKITAALSSSVI